MTIKCPKCQGIIETSEYSHPCNPQQRESLTHKLMMATVGRHKKHNDDLQLAKAAFTILRRFVPPRNDAASLRAWGYLNSVSQTVWTAALLETAHIQTRPSRRWNDNRALRDK
jgi:hypothetical protein